MLDVLFVHGTGIRRGGYEATMETLRARPALSQARVHGCQWGDVAGAPACALSSVPLYGQSKALGAKSDPSTDWAHLIEEPLIELSLAQQLSLESNPFATNSNEVFSAIPKLVNQLESHLLNRPSDNEAVPLEIRSNSLSLLIAATVDVRDMVGTGNAITKATQLAGGGQRGQEFAAHIVARAITAGWMSRAEPAGFPMPDAMGRNSLVDWLQNKLCPISAQQKAMYGNAMEALTEPLRKLGRLGGAILLHGGTWGSRRYRRSIADASHLVIGDVLLYQSRGERIRDLISDQIKSIGHPVVVLAHSLGGIAAFDLLVMNPGLPVIGFVTAGSQSPFLHELGALTSLPLGSPLPDHMPPWLNAFDCNDLLSFRAEPVFGSEKVQDIEMDSGQPFPVSHSAYWSQNLFWNKFGRFVSSL